MLIDQRFVRLFALANGNLKAVYDVVKTYDAPMLARLVVYLLRFYAPLFSENISVVAESTIPELHSAHFTKNVIRLFATWRLCNEFEGAECYITEGIDTFGQLGQIFNPSVHDSEAEPDLSACSFEDLNTMLHAHLCFSTSVRQRHFHAVVTQIRQYLAEGHEMFCFKFNPSTSKWAPREPLLRRCALNVGDRDIAIKSIDVWYNARLAENAAHTENTSHAENIVFLRSLALSFLECP